MNNNSYPGILADYGANLSQLVASLTIDEIHQLLGYKVEPELAKKAEGPIADILHVVQRPAVKERQNSIGEYIENLLAETEAAG
jgi:hypothetical protein